MAETIGAILWINIFKPIVNAIISTQYDPFYRYKKSRVAFFQIYDEPNMNHTCERIPHKGMFFAVFLDSEGKYRHTYFMNIGLASLTVRIEKLHLRIMANIHESDNLQSFLEMNSQRHDLTREYEQQIHHVKEDMCTIRKLESFLKQYHPHYISKPEYSGEQRDNVNTY